MQLTPRKAIGGRAWLSIKMSSLALEKALVLWANTSLGMLLRWWHSNKQQSGRGNIGKIALQSRPTIDVSALKPAQLEKAVKLFYDLNGKPMLPMHQIDINILRKTVL